MRRKKEPPKQNPILSQYKRPDGRTVTVYKPLTAEGSKPLSYEELERHVEASD